MTDEKESKMANLSDELQSGVLTNPSENALFNGDSVKDGDVTATIRAFQKRRFDDGKVVEQAWVVLFEEVDAGVKLNKTRTEQLFSIMGTNEMSNMIGRPITIAFDPTISFGGRKTGGVCLKRAEENLV